MEQRFVNYFKAELDSLRSQALDFSEKYPSVAAELALGAGKSSDPHVELLLQSFAYLSGKLNSRLDAESPETSTTTLDLVAPNLTTSIPSMAVACITVKPDGANFANGYQLKKQSQFYKEASTSASTKARCRFSTCYDTDLWPLRVATAGIEPLNSHEAALGHNEKFSRSRFLLRIAIESTGKDPIQDFPLSKLRFFLNADNEVNALIYELLTTHLVDVALQNENWKSAKYLGADAAKFIGFADEHGVLPEFPNVHTGYRYLQEYFHFPEKFNFFEIDGLDVDGAIDKFDLFLLFDAPSTGLGGLSAKNLLLNCIPLINLYTTTSEPIRLDHTSFEYKLKGDSRQYRSNEVHSIDSVSAINEDGSVVPLNPYFNTQIDEDRGYYWSVRRTTDLQESLPGTESFLSFHNRHLQLTDPPGESIVAKVKLTNRDLPEQLMIGDLLESEEGGPVSACTLVTKPSAHVSPALTGVVPWRLISQLSLNHLSICSKPDAISVFRALLQLHANRKNAVNQKQIDSLVGISSDRIARYLGSDAWRGAHRGLLIKVLLDENRFQGGSPLLFGAVLNQFLALYTSANSFIQLVLKSKTRKGEWYQWPPMAGEQALL